MNFGSKGGGGILGDPWVFFEKMSENNSVLLFRLDLHAQFL